METSNKKWWRLSLGQPELTFVKWSAPMLWILMAVDLIERLQAAHVGAAVTTFGIMLLMSTLMVGPNGFRIIEAAPGSNSRKALTIIALFGFLLQIAGLVARFANYMS